MEPPDTDLRYIGNSLSVSEKKMYFNAAGLQAHFVAVFRCAFIFQGRQGHLFQLHRITEWLEGIKVVQPPCSSRIILDHMAQDSF